MRKSRIWVTVAAALALIGIAEMAARKHQEGVYLFPVLGYQPCTQKTTVHDRPGCASPATFSTNRLGMRGDEPPSNWAASKTMIALGSSTTICHYNPDSLTWPSLVQKQTGAWVANAGIGGQTTRVNEVMMREILKRFRPSAFILLAGATDLNASMKQSHRERGTPHDEAVMKRFTRYPAFYWAYDRLALVRLAYWEYNRRKPSATVHSNPMSPFRLQGGSIDDRDSSFVLGALENYRKRIRAMADLSNSHGARLILITQPSLFRDNDEWRDKVAFQSEWNGETKSRSAAFQWRMVQKFNAETLALGGIQGVTVVDLAASMPADPALFYDGFHFTDKGCRWAAEFISAGI